MQTINVLYYEPTSGYGGSSRCLLSWLKKLNKKEYSAIVAVHFNGPAIQKIRQLGVKVITIPFKPILFKNNFPLFSYLLLFINFLIFYIPSAIFINILVKKHYVKILHLNAKVTVAIPGIIASIFSGIPCICHLHDIKVPVRLEKFFARCVDCFVVLTEKAFDLYGREYPNKRLNLIPNGVDLNEYNFEIDKKKVRAEFDIKDKEILIGIVGRLVEGKGFSDFLKAAQIIGLNNVNVKFIIVGDSGNEDKKYEIYLKNLAVNLGLFERTIFTGWREDVREIMSVVDIIVQPSSTFPEGFPLTIIEAMALGKPLVVTDVPGSSEIVVNGKTAYLVPPAKPEKLAEAIEKLINNRELALNMGEMGRKRVETLFSLEIIINKLENLYSSLLKKEIF